MVAAFGRNNLDFRWVELLGGNSNTLWVGDILIAFELVRKKDANTVPKRSIAPPRKPVNVQVSIHSLQEMVPFNTVKQRNIKVKEPRVLIGLPTYSESSRKEKNYKVVEWYPQCPREHAITEEDLNAQWTTGESRQSFQFLQVEKISCELPIDPVWAPGLEFKVPCSCVTPIFEDNIVIRVWDETLSGNDEVLIQGLLSFTSMRNRALAPRYFNFYAFPKKEVKDITALFADGT